MRWYLQLGDQGRGSLVAAVHAVLTHRLSAPPPPPPGSIRKSNPGLELGVITVPGELPPGGDAERWLDSRNLTRIEVPPLSYPNYHTLR